MQVAYQLAASDEPQTQEILKSVVVVLNPSATPMVMSDSPPGTTPWASAPITRGRSSRTSPGASRAATSHYRFDMNRDLLAQSQPEVRAMMDGILRWHPQVFVDHHSTTSSFFFPPSRRR